MWWLTFSKILQIQLAWQRCASWVREGMKFLYLFFYTYAPLWGRKWVTARLAACFAFPARSALGYTCRNVLSRYRSASLAETTAEIPNLSKGQSLLKPLVGACRSLKNSSLKLSTNVFKLNLPSLSLSRPVNTENLFISPLSCYLYKGTADGALYIFITTPLPTPTHYLTPKSLSWPELAFLLHLLLYSWWLGELLVKCFAEVLQAVLTRCSPFSGGFLCP